MQHAPDRTETERLATMIRDSLILADVLRLDVVAIHLDAALSKLVGTGIDPSAPVD